MGLPEGWIADVPGLSVRTQVRAAGNGVVPQQAAYAVVAMGRTLAAYETAIRGPAT